ncbi:MAG: bifunctional 5,10-methylenetetrahydrofolate dehydrogenase/5,10-methenyltetrahydrofolate cyclohydrolase [Patescibacteria group bacterium]
MEVLDGKKIAKKIEDKIAKEIYELVKNNSRRPSLAIVLAGDRSDSELYVSLKEKSAKSVGIDTSLYRVSEDDSEESFISLVDFLNKDDEVDGILIQLPLPKKFNTENILKKIEPTKDVDGFCKNRPKDILSPVVLAIKENLDKTKKDFKNKKAYLFYNSEIFKSEVENFLKGEGIFLKSFCMKNIERLSDENIKKIKGEIADCEIIISAVGSPEFIDKKFLKDNLVLIDIGIKKVDKKVFGDFKFKDAKDFGLYITPVPGGIGPITVASVLKNTLIAYKLRKGL